MRRLVDILLGGLGLIIASPVMMAIAILLLSELPEPIFWVSQRVGKDGRIFNFYNFRTMKADENNHKYLTTIGRFIRNYSLDHLPQLFNVIKGDLNLMGFRPPLPEDVNFADPDWQKILTVKPGMFSFAILGLANKYNSSGDKTRNDLELEYIQRRSLSFDFQVLFKSILGWITSRGNIKARGKPWVEEKKDI